MHWSTVVVCLFVHRSCSWRWWGNNTRQHQKHPTSKKKGEGTKQSINPSRPPSIQQTTLFFSFSLYRSLSLSSILSFCPLPFLFQFSFSVIFLCFSSPTSRWGRTAGWGKEDTIERMRANEMKRQRGSFSPSTREMMLRRNEGPREWRSRKNDSDKKKKKKKDSKKKTRRKKKKRQGERERKRKKSRRKEDRENKDRARGTKGANEERKKERRNQKMRKRKGYERKQNEEDETRKSCKSEPRE